jgi:hypothetical protein
MIRVVYIVIVQRRIGDWPFRSQLGLRLLRKDNLSIRVLETFESQQSLTDNNKLVLRNESEVGN